jgi:carbon-monoxide dehydrogenase small subunit
MTRMLDVLRDVFGLTGAKEGCGEGECGACAILLDGLLVNSCLLPLALVEGRQVMTIEGYRETSRFQVLSRCFEQAGAVQCGFCTPGMILAAEALLSANPSPSREEILQGLSGNLCRCTGYTSIVEAVEAAAKEGEGLWPVPFSP